jgi:serine/threonine-protein kinase
MPPITELTGRYYLHELIAVGGMGEVWRAADRVLARPVAVKLLRPEYSGDEVTLIRFRAEARHAGLLTHPGIAQVYDYQDATPERPAYLVMELVDGPSLAGLLAGGRLVPERTADVLAQAAAALQAAHAAGVLHRDIKPGNLLLASDGRVKVTDFGVAQSVLTGNLTRTGTLVGTTGYLAPERVSGRQATVASDLYALGIVGYECLTGQPPFQGEPLQVALAHRDQDLPGLPPWCLSQPGGDGLAALIADLTAKDPAARPDSAAVVAERARHLRNGLAGWRHTLAGPTRPDEAARPAGPDPANALPSVLPACTSPSAAPPAGPPPAGPVPGGSPGVPFAVPFALPSGTPSRARRRRRMAAAGLPGGILAAGLLGWLLATAQAHPASAPPAPRGGTPALTQQTAAPDRSAAPSRSAAPGRTVSVSPAGPRRAPPARAAGGAHVSPGRAKHRKGPPPGHR